jgi:hypothetical protein
LLINILFFSATKLILFIEINGFFKFMEIESSDEKKSSDNEA